MVLKKSKIKIPYIRLNFRIVRQSDARWCERPKIPHQEEFSPTRLEKIIQSVRIYNISRKIFVFQKTQFSVIISTSKRDTGKSQIENAKKEERKFQGGSDNGTQRREQ